MEAGRNEQELYCQYQGRTLNQSIHCGYIKIRIHIQFNEGKQSTQFLDILKAKAIADNFGTPVYVYDEKRLKQSAEAVLNFPNAYGLTARYAMKASPNKAIKSVSRTRFAY